jgi:TolB-like protein
MKIPKVFSYEEIEIELKRVLNFSLFKNSPTLSVFLEYIVNETLHDRSKSIKEYNIAINVLKRPSSFNCKDDAIVRIHAGRLRRALNLYYVTEGKKNPFFIDVPKGSYVPHFNQQTQSDSDNSYSYPLVTIESTNPIVAIFPFKCLSEKKEEKVFSLHLGEEFSAELSRFNDVSVIGYYSAEMMAKINENILEAGKLVKADYIITGSIQFIGESVRIRVNLLVALTGEVMMTKAINKEINNGIFEIQDEIIQSFIGAIGGYYGCIFHEMETAAPIKASANTKMREGIYGYHRYQRDFTVENFKTAVSTLEETIKIHTDSSVALAMLGELYLDGILLRIDTIPNPLEAGYRCSAEALKIDPLCQHAWHTLSLVYLFKKDRESCFRSAFQCLELNPNSIVMTCNLGFVLVCAGYFEEGFQLMQKGIKFNPDYPWFVNGGLCFYFIYKKEYATAFYWAEKMNTGETFWDPLLKLVCLSYMKEQSDIKKNLTKLLELAPDAPAKIKEMIPCLILSDSLALQIITGLEKAGLQLL